MPSGPMYLPAISPQHHNYALDVTADKQAARTLRTLITHNYETWQQIFSFLSLS